MISWRASFSSCAKRHSAGHWLTFSLTQGHNIAPLGIHCVTGQPYGWPIMVYTMTSGQLTALADLLSCFRWPSQSGPSHSPLSGLYCSTGQPNGWPILWLHHAFRPASGISWPIISPIWAVCFWPTTHRLVLSNLIIYGLHHAFRPANGIGWPIISPLWAVCFWPTTYRLVLSNLIGWLFCPTRQ